MLKLKRYVSNKKLFIYIFIFSIQRILFLLAPTIVQNFIDSAVAKNITLMKKYMLINILIFISTQLIMYLFDIIENNLKTESISNIYDKLNSNLEYYDTKNTNVDRDRVNQEIGHNLELLKDFIFEKPIKCIFSCITIVAIIVIVYNLSKFLALIMIFTVPISSYISFKLGIKVSQYSEHNIKDLKNLKGFILDKHQLNKSERLLTFKQLKSISTLINQFKSTMRKKYRFQSFLDNILIYAILNGVILTMQLLSGYLVFKGVLTIGSFFAVQLYISQFWTPIEYLFKVRSEYLTAKPAIHSFNEFMNPKLITVNDEKINTITMSNISLLDGKNEVLNEPISLYFDNKNINVIVGENGSGKTTLIEAIMNYNNRYQGDIYINNNSIENFSFEDIVYIPAEYWISEYGILKDKYNSSSGQKKIAQIELALKTNKSVYIFDEPTNFLDKQNKLYIIQIIENLFKDNKIIIIISHDEVFRKLDNVKIKFLKDVKTAVSK